MMMMGAKVKKDLNSFFATRFELWNIEREDFVCVSILLFVHSAIERTRRRKKFNMIWDPHKREREI